MDLPHFLLDPLEESISSGIFIDTKFYVFSRRDASGRVGSPRPLYCNSHVLNTVPHFSTCKQRNPPRCCASNDMSPKCSRMAFRKGKCRISTMDFLLTPSLTPSPMTTYLIATSRTMSSSSRMAIAIQTRTLRLEPPRSHDRGHKVQARLKTTTCELFLSNRSSSPPNLHPRPGNCSARMGKVAVIGDMAAVTYVKPTVNPTLRLIDPR